MLMLVYKFFMNMLTFSGYSKAQQRVSSLQSVSTAGARSLWEGQGIYEFYTLLFALLNKVPLILIIR